MTTDDIIDDVLRREGGFVDHPADRGGPTHYGITQPTLARWRGRAVSVDEVRSLTAQEARDIYRALYVERPGFAAIQDDRLRALLVDWAVHSGALRVVRAVQRLVGVTPDGQLGPVTLAAIHTALPQGLYAQVVRARGAFLADLLQRDPSQRVFAAGWLRRLMEFV